MLKKGVDVGKQRDPYVASPSQADPQPEKTSRASSQPTAPRRGTPCSASRVVKLDQLTSITMIPPQPQADKGRESHIGSVGNHPPIKEAEGKATSPNR